MTLYLTMIYYNPHVAKDKIRYSKMPTSIYHCDGFYNWENRKSDKHVFFSSVHDIIWNVNLICISSFIYDIWYRKSTIR